MADRIALKRGTAAEWNAANPVLFAGEPGLEMDTRKTKYGDGTTHWNSLPYWVDSGGGGIDSVKVGAIILSY
jgi:hypothetical protein